MNNPNEITRAEILERIDRRYYDSGGYLIAQRVQQLTDEDTARLKRKLDFDAAASWLTLIVLNLMFWAALTFWIGHTWFGWAK